MEQFPQPQPQPSKKRRSLLTSRVTPGMALLVIGAIAGLRLWVVETAYVEGNSMLDTLHPGDRVLILKTLEPKRFDIVVFKDPQEGGIDIKRVVGMPGEVLWMVPKLVAQGETEIPMGGEIYVDEKRLVEPYATAVVPSALPARKIFPTRRFVLGDNRDASIDSGTYGGVEVRDIRGVAVAVVYPLSRARLITAAEAEAAGARVESQAGTGE